MTAVTFPLRPPRLAFAICGWRWQNDLHEIKYISYPIAMNKMKHHSFTVSVKPQLSLHNNHPYKYFPIKLSVAKFSEHSY